MKKDQGIAALLTFLIPGAGQIYAERIGRGIAIFITAIFLAVLVLRANPLVGITYLIFWVWAIYDAHQIASGVPIQQATMLARSWSIPSLGWTIAIIGLVLLGMLVVIFSFGRIIPGGPLDRLIHL